MDVKNDSNEKMTTGQKTGIALGVVAVSALYGIILYQQYQKNSIVNGFINSSTIDHVANQGDTLSEIAAFEGVPTKQLGSFIEAVRFLNHEGFERYRGAVPEPKVTSNGKIFANVGYKLPDFNGDAKVGTPNHFTTQKNISHNQIGHQYQRR